MLEAGVRSRVVAVLVLAAAPIAPRAWATEATFNDPNDVPAAPRPPTLPELTHSEPEGTLEATAGAIVPNSPNSSSGFTHGFVQRLSLELPVGIRRWYVGASYEIAAAGGLAVSGNLELQGRSLWATRTGLAFGGGLALIAPTASFQEGGRAGAAALAAATLRPWDVAFFIPSAIGGRPFIDVRAIDGPFVAQFRQSLDLLWTTASWAPQIYATVEVYVGLWATKQVAAGVEAFEAYAISVPHVQDGARAAVVISPNVRLVLPWVEPAISAFTNIGTPLKGASDRIWGFRLAFTLVYDPTQTLHVRTQRGTGSAPAGSDDGEGLDRLAVPPP
jgi:hypothetical protein